MSRLFFYRHIEGKANVLELVSQTNGYNIIVVE